jgi:hypothetical protein
MDCVFQRKLAGYSDEGAATFGAIIRTGSQYRTVLTTLARTELLIIDDWGLQPLDDQGRLDLLEILEDRYYVRSVVVTSKLPVSNWHEAIGDPTLVYAILGRLVHNAYQINLKGESRRKKLNQLTQTGHYDKQLMPSVATLRQVADFHWIRWPNSLDYAKGDKYD